MKIIMVSSKSSYFAFGSFFPFLCPYMVIKGPVFSMFHQKSRGVSLILFSDGVPEMESVEKPNYARHGHGASILDHTIKSITP